MYQNIGLLQCMCVCFYVSLSLSVVCALVVQPSYEKRHAPYANVLCILSVPIT